MGKYSGIERIMKERPKPGVGGSMTFREMVDADIKGELETDKRDYLRRGENVGRWYQELDDIHTSLKAQFTAKKGDPRYRKWRAQTVKFQEKLLQKKREAKQILKEIQRERNITRHNGMTDRKQINQERRKLKGLVVQIADMLRGSADLTELEQTRQQILNLIEEKLEKSIEEMFSDKEKKGAGS